MAMNTGHHSPHLETFLVSWLLSSHPSGFPPSSFVLLHRFRPLCPVTSNDILPLSTRQSSAQFYSLSLLTPSPSSYMVIALINTRSQSKSRADLFSAFCIFNANTGYHKVDSNRDLKLEPFPLHFPALPPLLQTCHSPKGLIFKAMPYTLGSTFECQM